jgi:hypothetical protein
MPFVKGDPNINRNGRPKNAEPDLLRKALEDEGEKRGISFWEKVAEYAFRDRTVMIAVVKKFIPDMNDLKVEGNIGGGTKIIIVRSGEPIPEEKVADTALTISR